MDAVVSLLTATGVLGPLAAAAGGGLLIAGFIGLLDHLSRRAGRGDQVDPPRGSTAAG
jgi:hypothetical protein